MSCLTLECCLWKQGPWKPVIFSKSNNRKREFSFFEQFVKSILFFKKHMLNYRKEVIDNKGDSDFSSVWWLKDWEAFFSENFKVKEMWILEEITVIFNHKIDVTIFWIYTRKHCPIIHERGFQRLWIQKCLAFYYSFNFTL